MKFVKALDNDLYNIDQMLKIVKNKGSFNATFDVMININNNDVYVQKSFDENDFDIQELPDNFVLIDDNLILNMNKVLKVTQYGDDEDGYTFFTTDSKKRIGTKFLNYNIKVSGRNKAIENLINECIKLKNKKGENVNKMNNWMKHKNNFYNMNNVTNIRYNIDNYKIIINFKNTESNLRNIENIRPSYEIENFSNEESLLQWLKEATVGMLKLGDRYVNLDNVYNIKFDDRNNIIYINFTSNVTKNKEGLRIVSTEFVKYECKSDAEFNEKVKEIEEFLKKGK